MENSLSNYISVRPADHVAGLYKKKLYKLHYLTYTEDAKDLFHYLYNDLLTRSSRRHPGLDLGPKSVALVLSSGS